jgi:Holliday junction resolvase RusA-like endonuclease
MIEFEQTDNLKKIIEEEQAKYPAPFGFTGEFNEEALIKNMDPIIDQIRRIAEDLDYRTSLYLICDMARRWVEDHPGAVVWQGMIPINPKTKKNSQRIVRNPKTKGHMILQSEAYKQYEKDAGWFVRNKQMQPIDFPVNIKYTFYRENQIRCDGLNLSAAMDDILVKYGILADDNFKIVAGHDGTRVYIDKDNPRTEIEITRMPNYNPNNGGGNNG